MITLNSWAKSHSIWCWYNGLTIVEFFFTIQIQNWTNNTANSWKKNTFGRNPQRKKYIQSKSSLPKIWDAKGINQYQEVVSWCAINVWQFDGVLHSFYWQTEKHYESENRILPAKMVWWCLILRWGICRLFCWMCVELLIQMIIQTISFLANVFVGNSFFSLSWSIWKLDPYSTEICDFNA